MMITGGQHVNSDPNPVVQIDIISKGEIIIDQILRKIDISNGFDTMRIEPRRRGDIRIGRKNNGATSLHEKHKDHY
jgi:hypothetical protein